MHRPTRVSFVLALGCLTGVASAQNGAGAEEGAGAEPVVAPAPTPDQQKTPAVRLSLEAFGGYEFESKTDDGDAAYSVFRAGGSVTLDWSTSESLSLSFGIGYDYADYDFDDFRDLVAGVDSDDPFDEFNLVSFSVSGLYQIDPTWSVLLGGFARAGWESGADVGDAWTGGGYGAVGFRLGETLSLGFGVGATTQHDDDAFVFPVITVSWRITEVLRLESQRLGARLTYTLNESVDLYARAEYFRREYRLSDHEVIGEGVFRDSRVPVGLGVDWRPIGGLTVGFEAGAMVYTELRFYNDDGDRVARTNADVSPYLALTLRYTF